jgi:hypothetical protein
MPLDTGDRPCVTKCKVTAGDVNMQENAGNPYDFSSFTPLAEIAAPCAQRGRRAPWAAFLGAHTRTGTTTPTTHRKTFVIAFIQ